MPSAKKFLSANDVDLVMQAIAAAEKATSGEIRVHLENFCFGDPVEAAKRVFIKLGMQATKERNGVLIYLATRSRKFAVIGDEGIHKKVGAAYWQETVSKMSDALHANRSAEGLIACIEACGKQLQLHFPYASDDRNELSDEISYN